MQKILDKIIQADLRAQQLAAEAEEKQKNLKAEIEEKKLAMRKMYTERAEARLNKIRGEEENLASQQTERNKSKAKESLERLEKICEANRTKWIEEITQRITTP